MGMLLRRRHDKAEIPDELGDKALKSEDEKETAEEIEVEQVPEPQESTEDVDELTVAEIKERLDAAVIEYKSSDKKPDLIEKLKGE